MPKDILEEIDSIYQEAKENAVKFYEKGNKAAGTRARSFFQELKKKIQEARLDIQAIKNGENKKSSCKSCKK